MKKIRIGLMGLGQIGRQIYRLALQDERFEVVAISDIGRPEILHHLLNKAMGKAAEIRLESNYLIGGEMKSRLIPADHPTEIPWDVFGADVVIDATGKFRSAEELQPHVDNGAGRVIISTLPLGDIDRVVLCGVNEASADASDRIISAGSGSTTATALAFKVIAERFEINHATLTSVHAYTSDQSLQDYAGPDYRRSRSGAENIIPNVTPALDWVQRSLPAVDGRLTAYALNVPVQVGSMLDVTASLAEPLDDIEVIRDLFVEAAQKMPHLIETTEEPIVSSDVKGSACSLLVDLKGTMKAGTRMAKLIAWHESLGHASRVLDVAALYSDMPIETLKEAS
jgi:glyceraldehyde 3-phosphate dehydrogenase